MPQSTTLPSLTPAASPAPIPCSTAPVTTLTPLTPRGARSITALGTPEPSLCRPGSVSGTRQPGRAVHTSHHSSSRKSESSSNVTSTSSHSSGSSCGAMAYWKQKPGPHFQQQQQQALGLSQARPEGSIPGHSHDGGPPHNSRSAGTGTVHLYLAAAATHLPSQPGPTYTPTQAPGSTWWPLRARCSTAYSTLPTQLAPTVMSCEHGTLGPGLVHPPPQPVFSHQTYMSTSPASTVYTGYPLRCTKVNQYPYIPSSGSGRERRENG